MQNDEIIWQVINHGHCSFKAKTETQTFCRNQYNLTGLCNRSSCPLANSRYATIIQKDGICYLYMKTIERAHTPDKLWERVKLSANYEQALQQINQHLEYWPNYMINKAKLRLAKIREYLARMRKLKLKEIPRKVAVTKKNRVQQDKREAKALIAANLDKKIEAELERRLKQGMYPDTEDIVNIPQTKFDQVLNKQQVADEESDEEVEYEFDASQYPDLQEENENEDEQEEEEEGGEIEFVEDYDIDDIDDIEENEYEKEYNEQEEEEEPIQNTKKRKISGNTSKPAKKKKKNPTLKGKEKKTVC